MRCAVQSLSRGWVVPTPFYSTGSDLPVEKSTYSLKRTEQTNENIPPNRGGIFFGWWIVLGSLLVLIVSSGIGFYGHSVLLDPLKNQYGWSKGVISSAISLYFIVSGIVGMLISRSIDANGPRYVLVIGSLVFGFSLMLLGFIKEVWHLFIIYTLMAVGWAGTALIPINTLIINWFIRKRGLAMSITMSGLSIGGILMVPLSIYMISLMGLKIALFILGTLYWLVIIPLALTLFKQRPSDIGQYPDGAPAPQRLTDGAARTQYLSTQIRRWTRRQAMRTMAFWSIVTAFLLALTGQIAFLIHQVSFLSQTLGRSGAATAVSITASASIAGRLALGPVVDRYDKRFVTMALFLLQAAGVFSMAYSNSIPVLYLGTFIFGLTMGSLLMMQSLIIGDCFGYLSFATVSGMVSLFVISGSAIGPALAGFIYDTMGSYRTAFLLFVAMSFAAAGAIYFARPPGAERKG
jgi:MFS family permease